MLRAAFKFVYHESRITTKTQSAQRLRREGGRFLRNLFALCVSVVKVVSSTSSLSKAALLAVIILAIDLQTVGANQVGDFLGRRVTRVDVVIEEAPESPSGEMRNLLEVAAGQDYSPVRIHDSLVRLYRSGLISSARVEATAEGANGVVLRFIVRPQARIDAVVFEGETGFPAAELRSRLNQLDPGTRLSPGAVTRAVGDLLAYYSARGYYQAQIVPDIRLDPTGTRAVIAFNVTPGKQAVVSNYTLNINGARIDLSKIQHAIVEGRIFTQSNVQQEMDQIRNAYLSQDYLAVRTNQNITPNPKNNTVAVTMNVETGPKMTVEVQGLEISDKQKRSLLPFYNQGGVDEFTLEEGRRRLQDYAQRQGYFFAQINRPAVPDLTRETARIDYVIDTGRRYKLSNIEVEGMDAIPSEAIQQDMKSREASFIPLFGLNRGLTSDDMLRQDSNLILRRLRELGYRRAQVDVLRGVSLTGDDLIITFNVTQGPRSYVEAIGIRGNSVMTREQLREQLVSELNEPLVASEVNQGTDKIVSAYTTNGYYNVEVLSGLADLGSFDGQDRVRLLYDINEGNRVRIRNIFTRGAGVTKVSRLERDFYLFKSGEWLRAEQLQETERRLYETNAFNSVNITSEPTGQLVNGVEERDVTVNLLEAKRYDAIFGFGYQTNKSQLTIPGLGFLNGARGLVQLTQTNMFGRLYTGSAQVRVSENELFGNISFQNPRPFGTDFPTLISFFARRLAEKSFRTDRYTATIQAERRVSQEFIVYLSYNFERISIFSLPCTREQALAGECEPTILEEFERNTRPIRLGRIGPSFAYDTRDNKFDPTAGSQTLGSFFFASKFLGGNEQFVKLTLEHNRHYKISRFRDTVYSVSGRLGLATPFGGAETLPISERFFAGGARDLRGFGFEEAGPQTSFIDPVTNETRQFPLGGNGLLVINNELRFPIWKILGGAVFSDTGNVFRRVRDMKPGNLTQTIGFGFRVKTPVGPVRLDFGWLVLNKPEGVKGFHRHFSIGQSF